MPASTSILQIKKHTSVKWNFRVSYNFPVYYGQFVEVSLPMIGEAPTPVSDLGDGWVDLLIRRVGRVTEALFGLTVDDTLWLRGAYGSGYDLDLFTDRSVLIVAVGTGVAPIKGLLSHLCKHADLVKRLSVILGYKNSESILYKKELASWRENCSLYLTLDEGKAEQDFFVGSSNG